MSAGGLDALVDSLLWEGYALYPYTPGATKNATPTPFGIVYPPAYADGRNSFDHLVVQCMADAPGGAGLGAEVRFLQPAGERHEAEPRTASLPQALIGGERVVREESFEGSHGRLDVRLTLTQEAADGRTRITLRVENLTEVERDLDRGAALRRSLISTHPILRLEAGRFISPLEAGSGCESVNSWPVLASDADDAILGAAIVLPDHPRLAPESLGGLFDSTEIEEALLLHVQTLSDSERAAIEAGDPAVAEMVARAASATPEEVLALHGRMELRDPVTREPPKPSAAVRDPTRGEAEATADGKTFRRGGRVLLRPGPDADLHARMVDGRTATIERIFVDYDGRVHLAVTIDGDPGQELMRETSRFLFFFPPEVEVIE